MAEVVSASAPAKMALDRSATIALLTRIQILAAHDGWVRECNEVADHLGLAAADERSTIAMDAYKALVGELARTPATTSAGILAKARLGAQLYGSEKPFEDPGSHDVDRVAFSIVRDVLALLGADEARGRGDQS